MKQHKIKTFQGSEPNSVLRIYTDWVLENGEDLEIIDVIFNRNIAKYEAYEITIIYN